MKDSKQQIELWNGLRAGNEKSLHLLYTLYFSDLLRYGMSLTGDFELSKEYINLLFLSLWNNGLKLPEVKSPKAYIITCYKNKIFFRKKKPGDLTIIYSNALDNLSKTVSSYEETLIELQEYEKLKQTLKKELAALTERQRQIIELRFLQEMTYEEVAVCLTISVRTVYNSIHESLKILRSQINKKDFKIFCLLVW